MRVPAAGVSVSATQTLSGFVSLAVYAKRVAASNSPSHTRRDRDEWSSGYKSCGEGTTEESAEGEEGSKPVTRRWVAHHGRAGHAS